MIVRRRLWFHIAPWTWGRKTAAMPANRCTTCDANWPRHHTKCPECGAGLKYKQSAELMSKEEYDKRTGAVKADVAKAKKEATALDEVVRKKLVAAEQSFASDWEYAVREAERRNRIGGKWDAVDIIEELADLRAHDREAA